MKIFGLICLTLMAALVGAFDAGAQEARSQAAQRGGDPQGVPTVPEGSESPRVALALANALDQYALIQARRALALDDAQYEKLVPRLRALQQTRRRNQQTRHRIIQQLRRMVGPKSTDAPEEAAIRSLLETLEEHDQRAASELRAAYDALDEVLTPRQQARFRLFEENIEARKLELLMRARARAGRGGS